ncbi:nuclear pore complex protein Nup50-like [Tenrec ecaudatus]|uniref:nuclear pore complex protein Nup50-like n=1 Tax=Tenrec ecaudatus TaxID=94439 RepID=UPI003F5A09B5
MAERILDKELTGKNRDPEDETEVVAKFSVAGEEVLKKKGTQRAKCGLGGWESDSAALGRPRGGGDGADLGKLSGMETLGLSQGSSVASAAVVTSTKAPAEMESGLEAVPANDPPSLVEAKLPHPEGRSPGPQLSASASAHVAGPGHTYFDYLAALNYDVRDWIIKQVNLNPCCQLTPIFRDYEKHLVGLRQYYGAAAGEGSGPAARGGAPAELGREAPFPPPGRPSAAPSAPAAKAEPEAKAGPGPGATNASVNVVGRRVDSAVWGSLSLGALTGDPFENRNLFGEDAARSTPGDSPSVTKVPKSQARGQAPQRQ